MVLAAGLAAAELRTAPLAGYRELLNSLDAVGDIGEVGEELLLPVLPRSVGIQLPPLVRLPLLELLLPLFSLLLLLECVSDEGRAPLT